MFTGRIEEIGVIASVMDDRIVVRAPKSAGRVRPGGSLNVAGVRVTAEHQARRSGPENTVIYTVPSRRPGRQTFCVLLPVRVIVMAVRFQVRR